MGIRQYTDFQGVTHMTMSDNHLVEVMYKEKLEILMRLREMELEVKELKDKLESLKGIGILTNTKVD